MSKPRFKWWGYVKAVVRAYPRHLQELREKSDPHITPACGSAIPKTSGTRRATECAALCTLRRDDQKELEAVEMAIKRTTAIYKNAAERLRLIDMVFWKQTHNLTGAALALYVSYETAQRWHKEFIQTVAVFLEIYHPE